MYLTGVYGGYFGAAQGIMLLAILGVVLPQDLHRTNALKNVLAGMVNGVAGLYFIFAAHIDWEVAAIIAGAAHLRRPDRSPVRAAGCSPGVLRVLIVIVGVSAIVATGA